MCRLSSGTRFLSCSMTHLLSPLLLNHLASAAAVAPLVDAADEFVVNIHLLGLDAVRPDCFFMYHDLLNQLVEDSVQCTYPSVRILCRSGIGLSLRLC